MKLTKLGKELNTQFEKYKKDDKRAVPVMAMAFNEKKGLFFGHCWNESQKNNSKAKHAEILLLEEIDKIKKGAPFDIVVTLAPCFKCFMELYKNDKIKNIYFIFEKTWVLSKEEKVIKKIIEDSKGKISIIKFPKSISKKSIKGVDAWGKELTLHLNNNSNNKKRGKVKYIQENKKIILKEKNETKTKKIY
ncbi:hypothetical protein [Mycoplasma todarodis]|uniref:CMP/dCMP-type deaminase domain-containing protein n=1 Tax=Mycoplasma todarodis TaxID=1937191 RepID=A0A4V2NIA5_9MOLU|nr:hypothetical protein [Mycoplasma todarodis]TCG12106.1 hypothetical protein C4B25_00225 [Mycoplasma todarodis]